MPDKYTVQENDTLSKIASQFHFRDGGEAIWKANPDLSKKTNGNRDVLRPGWTITIPDKQQKESGKATDQQGQHKVPQVKKNLCLLLQDAEGKPVTGDWTYRFVQTGKNPQKGSAAKGKIVIKDIDENTAEATLEVFQSRVFGMWKSPPEKIKLVVGGLDPISEGSDGVAAIQKILTNLGYYHGEVDGDAGPLTHAAIFGFQHDYMPQQMTGQIDKSLCLKLQEGQGSPIGIERVPDDLRDPKMDNAVPLTQYPEASNKTEEVTGFSEYEEPTNNDPTGPGVPPVRTKMGTLRFFPRQAYVAPCAPGEEDQKGNNIRMPSRKFIFLDAGNFYGNHTTFGVIWGHHVYLCKFTGDASSIDPPSDPASPRLDDAFFAALSGNVEVISRASATWAPYSDFDWDSLYLIVPDMHLMTAETATIWHGNAAETNYTYPFDVELKFLAFAKAISKATKLRLFQALKSSLQIVQIGDFYDLWIACEPCLFQKNETRQVVLAPDAPLTDPNGQLETPQQRIANWVKAIQDSCPHGYKQNPAVDGLRLLRKDFGGIKFIYGNHDNYLILEEVCDAAGIDQRQRWVDYPGVFIEHGHRLEATFADKEVGGVMQDAGLTIMGTGVEALGSLPHNYDGDTSGYIAANGAYKDLSGNFVSRSLGKSKKTLADPFAMVHDQPQYWGEFAQMWLGRQATEGPSSPHICVIGHTHIPNLLQINIRPWRIG